MTIRLLTLVVLLGVVFTSILPAANKDDNSKRSTQPAEHPIDVAEARGRAKLLHETIHATLHVVHHQYFRDDEGLQIPSLTMEAVFKELERSCKVNLRWIAVDAQAMSVDHNPRDDFERQAARALAAGDEAFQRVEGGVFRYAGSITLSNQCLKCHVPNRRDTKARTAGLVIGMRVKQD